MSRSQLQFQLTTNVYLHYTAVLLVLLGNSLILCVLTERANYQLETGVVLRSTACTVPNFPIFQNTNTFSCAASFECNTICLDLSYHLCSVQKYQADG